MVALGQDARSPVAAERPPMPGDAGTPAGGGSRLRLDLAVLATLGALAVGVPLAMAAAAGSVGFASNDDWVYMRGALALYRTGTIDLPGHTASTVGQLALVQPLLWLAGGATWAFTAYGLLMGWVAVTATYLLARRFVSVGSAVLAVAILLFYPGVGRQLATFMTDMPACALSTLCLLLGVRWLQGSGGRLTLVASLVVGLLGVSIREFVLAAPLAILVASWLRNRHSDRRLLAVGSMAFAIGVVAVELLGQTVANRGAPSTFGLSVSLYSIPAFMTLAAAVLPAIVLAIGRRLDALRGAHVIIAAVLVAFGMVAVPDGPFVGYIWSPAGAVSGFLLMGDRDQVMAPRLWVLSEQLALLGSVFAMTLMIRYLAGRFGTASGLSGVVAAGLAAARRPDAPLVLFLCAYGTAMLAFGTFFPLYDRYLYPLVPAATIVLLRPFSTRRPPIRTQALSHAALLWLALSAFLVNANSFAYDAARFRAGNAAVALGYSADTIDAGPEWVGFHAAGHETPGSHDYGLMPYLDIWADFYPCAVLSNSAVEMPGFVLVTVDQAAYRNLLFFGPEEPIYLYGSTSPRCPAPPTADRTFVPLQVRDSGAYTAARAFVPSREARAGQ